MGEKAIWLDIARVCGRIFTSHRRGEEKYTNLALMHSCIGLISHSTSCTFAESSLVSATYDPNYYCCSNKCSSNDSNNDDYNNKSDVSMIAKSICSP